MKKILTPVNLIIAAAIVILAVSFGLLASNHLPGIQADITQKQTQSLYQAEPTGTVPESQTMAISTENTEEGEEELPENAGTAAFEYRIQDDFVELYKTNPDIVGWLKASDIIDYPVVQRDNDYYLNHNFNGGRDSNGTLFVNMGNTLDPRDDVILIHGHHMKSGRMFGAMNRYEKEKYLAEHPLVTFRTIYDAEDVYYTPIAVFNASMDEDDPEYFDVTQILFDDDADSDGDVRKSAAFQAYLDSLKKWSYWEPKVDVTVDDQLLMLITCSYHHTAGRLMLVCRALRDGETPESITALYQEKN